MSDTGRMPPAFVRSMHSVTMKGIDENRIEATHVISTKSPDRAGDVVNARGINLENYMRNPVVLADHDYTIASIIGRAVDIQVEDDSVTATTRFADTPLGRDAFNLVKTGFARAWSIGFRPGEYEPIKDAKGVTKGFNYKTSELLEYSLVAVPMNPDAVMNAVKSGIVQAKNVKVLLQPALDELLPGQAADGSSIPAEVASDRQAALELMCRDLNRSVYALKQRDKLND